MNERVDYSHHVREHDSRVVQLVLAALGFVFVGVGVAGVLLPVLPATPFFLLAAACFARASARFDNWLLNHRVVGPTVREWQMHHSIPYRTKLWAIALMSGTLAISTIFFVEGLVLQLLLTTLGVLLATWLWRAPPASLDGATIGLMSISKEWSREFLDAMERLLAGRGLKVERFEKPTPTPSPRPSRWWPRSSSGAMSW